MVGTKLIVLFLAGFVCIVLLIMTPLLAAKAMASTMEAGQAQGMVLGFVSAIMSTASGFGTLMAAWAATDVICSETRAGTILAVTARLVRFWEFLLAKYLGVQLLMVVYMFGMLGLSYFVGMDWWRKDSIHPVGAVDIFSRSIRRSDG